MFLINPNKNYYPLFCECDRRKPVFQTFIKSKLIYLTKVLNYFYNYQF